MSVARRGRARPAVAVLALAALLAVASLEIAARLLPPPPMATASMLSQVVTAADGSVLRGYLAGDDHWRLAATVDDVPPLFVDLLLAYEDRRFARHWGVDPIAVLRAALQAARHGRVVSGASTLTMQVARLLEPMPPGIAGKLWQMLRARQLEQRLSKREILGLYLTLAPYGGNLAGVRAASLGYLGREPRDLGDAELALMVALPQAPERRRLDRHPHAAEAARRALLARLAPGSPLAERLRAAITAARAIAVRRPVGLLLAAPHLADRLRALAPESRTIASDIDAPLQRAAEAIARDAVASADVKATVAVVVVRNDDGALVGYVGGSGYGATGRAGYVDHAAAVRSPGSTLKPFIYGLGFEQRLIHPATVITDAPLGIGSYEPRNFSGDYVGDVTIRDALVKSINTAAVAVLARTGPKQLASRFASVGVPLRLDQPDGDVGLAIGLGGAGLRLVDLVALYRGLARGGLAEPPRSGATGATAGSAAAHRLLAEDAVYAVTDVLADMPAPAGFVRLASEDGGRRIAYKTGTSYSYRDAWAIGFDRLHTVGVWVGRSDGMPHIDAYGLTVAAPIMYRVFEALPVPAGDVAGEPPVASVFAPGAAVPARLARFETTPASTGGEVHRRALRIMFPRDGLEISPSEADNPAGLPLRVQGGTPPYTWLVDDRRIATSTAEGITAWWPKPEPGAARITVMDHAGLQHAVSIWIDPARQQ
jgi:penicillin-binding protein 1C